MQQTMEKMIKFDNGYVTDIEVEKKPPEKYFLCINLNCIHCRHPVDPMDY